MYVVVTNKITLCLKIFVQVDMKRIVDGEYDFQDRQCELHLDAPTPSPNASFHIAVFSPCTLFTIHSLR